MLVLAFDTATPCVAVALVELATDPTGHVSAALTVAASATISTNRHGELLATGIAAVLNQAGVAAGNLDAVAVGLGPGPFTGLRVGIVTAAALGQALAIPAYGCCSLDAVPAPPGVGSYAVITDARRREVYAAVYRDGARVDGPFVARPDAAVQRFPAGLHVVGPDASQSYPSAELIASRAIAAADRGLVPLYLRRPDAAEPGPTKTVLG